ncbi:hypothetical protein GQ53DRAFT_658179 [Thozetella sp. PMI_491]|nr:hypothetical protein GQ53DRAFT_658179 [Thozetella sp. PMI_491]
MSYYDNSQWPPSAGQATWDHQTPPPARSGASSTVPRDEPAAFSHQLEEVDRAIDNLVKSGKMFGNTPGVRRESLHLSLSDPARGLRSTGRRGRVGLVRGSGSRPHSVGDFGDPRGPHNSSNLQNFYASQRHQTSRGSNEAEQMMQAKRRMAAQRERELRNYHQEQQFNRTVLGETNVYPTTNKPSDRTLSPGSMSEDDRRDLIARQRSALYGEGPFAETGGYVDETGTPRPGIPGPNAPPTMRGHSPLAYEYGRAPPPHGDGVGSPAEGAQGAQSGGPNERSRANSNSSPQSNPSGQKGVFDAPIQQSSRTSASSPGGSPPRQGAPGSKPGQSTVAPIGTRPTASNQSGNPALNKRSTTPLPSPLSQGYTASGNDENANPTGATQSNPNSASAEGNVGLSGWGNRSGAVWGSKSGLGVQASVWG